MKIKCKVCGHEFAPVKSFHYISRDCDVTGVVTVLSNNETKLYDSFDCPACGCQCIPQERKRVFIPCLEAEEEVEHEACEEAETN